MSRKNIIKKAALGTITASVIFTSMPLSFGVDLVNTSRNGISIANTSRNGISIANSSGKLGIENDKKNLSDSITVNEVLTGNGIIRPNKAEALTWFTNIIFNKKPNEGDFFTIKLPEQININGDTREQAKLPDFMINNKKVATSSYDRKKNIITYTFTNEVNEYHKVKFDMNLKIFINRDKVQYSGDETLKFKVGNNTFNHEVRVDYQQITGGDNIITFGAGRINGSQNIIFNDIKEGKFRAVAYINPLRDEQDKLFRVDFMVNDKLESEREARKQYTKDPNSAYSLSKVRIYKLKDEYVIRDSFYYDYDNNPIQLELIKEINLANNKENFASITNEDVTISGNNIIAVIDGVRKNKDDKDKNLYVYTLSKSIKNARTDYGRIDPTTMELFSEVRFANHSNDARYEKLYDISGKVWLDKNSNGILESEENGLFGVTVYLKNQYGNTIASTSTDEHGEYSFSKYPNGFYTVEFAPKSNYKVTYGKDSKGLLVPINIKDSNRNNINLGLKNFKKGTFIEKHMYYNLLEGKNLPDVSDEPVSELSSEKSGSSDIKYTSKARLKKDYRLVKVDSSENVVKKPSIDDGDVRNNFINDETQSITYVYVKNIPKKKTSDAGTQTEEIKKITTEVGVQTEEPKKVTTEVGVQTEEPKKVITEVGTQTEETKKMTSESGTQTEEPKKVTSESGTQTEEPKKVTIDSVVQTEEPKKLTSESYIKINNRVPNITLENKKYNGGNIDSSIKKDSPSINSNLLVSKDKNTNTNVEDSYTKDKNLLFKKEHKDINNNEKMIVDSPKIDLNEGNKNNNTMSNNEYKSPKIVDRVYRNSNVGDKRNSKFISDVSKFVKKNKKTISPKTDDNTNIMSVLILLSISFLGMCFAIFRGKKEKNI